MAASGDGYPSAAGAAMIQSPSATPTGEPGAARSAISASATPSARSATRPGEAAPENRYAEDASHAPSATVSHLAIIPHQRARWARAAQPPEQAPRSLQGDRPHAPDALGVLADGAIGGELRGARDVQDRHPGPAVAVLVHARDVLLHRAVRGEVGEHHVRVAAVQERLHDGLEEPRLAGREDARRDRVEDLLHA